MTPYPDPPPVTGEGGFYDSQFTFHGPMKIYTVGGAVREELLGLPMDLRTGKRLG